MDIEADLERIRKIIDDTHRPLVFFDDDPDGLVSFLLLYKRIKESKGIILKSKPVLDEQFTYKLEEYGPDTIFIFDKPDVSEEFIQKTNNTPIVWVDHHPPVKRSRVIYFNPRNYDDSDIRATSYWLYRLVGQSLWLAVVGTVSDWQYIPELIDPFRDKYPDLLPEEIRTPEKALFESPVGKLARILAFNLKGTSNEAMSSVKILTRIESPYEILNKENSRGRYLYKKFEKYDEKYQELLKEVKVGKQSLKVFKYEDNRTSFSTELSNELIYRHPDKTFIICRRKSGEMKCSLRSTTVKLPPLISEGLKGVEGYGGGHDYACGANIKEKDFAKFVSQFRNAMNKA